MSEFLPRRLTKVNVPPLKIQGIKTKLVSFIAESIEWDGKGVWYEPFMGSGVVGFNIAPQRAVFSDTNPHIIRLYKDIQSGLITGDSVRKYLEDSAPKLAATPADKTSYYYTVRERFNENPNSLDFIFLQRSNFNGMVRFSGKGKYNVPFGRKPNRFRPALITKIVNQINWISYVMYGKEWKFMNIPYSQALDMVRENDFVYLDPPYIGRSTDYFNSWGDEDANKLAEITQKLNSGWALSMWYKNKYRTNEHLKKWHGVVHTNEHFYHIGGKEINRNAMLEALVVKNGFSANEHIEKYKQLNLTLVN